MTTLRLAVGFLGHKACRNFIFHAGILQLYLVAEGIAVETIFFAFGVQSVASMIFEVPAGALSDRYGRRVALICGIGIKSLGLVWLFASAEPIIVITSFVLMSLGNALVSGSDSALIYDALGNQKSNLIYRQLESWGYIIELGVYGGAAAIGSWVAYTVNLADPLLLSAAGTALGIAFVLLLPSEAKTENSSAKAYLGFFKFFLVVQQIVRHPPLCAAAVAYVAFNVIVSAGTLLYQPILEEREVSVVWFGVGIAVLVAVDMTAVWVGNRRPLSMLSRVQSTFLVNGLFAGFIILCIVSAWVPTPIALALVWAGYALHAAGDGLQYPLVRVWANDAFSGPERATMLSVLAGVVLLVMGAINPVLGILIETGGTPSAFLLLLGAWTAGVIGCWIAAHRIPAANLTER